jgi:predicted O-linked N-acetylglucosamine transferase (SPINDLY family)
VCEQLGRDAEAAALVKRAVRLKPGNLELSCSAASLLYHAGRDEEAQELLSSVAQAIHEAPEIQLLSAILMPTIVRNVNQILSKRESFDATLRQLCGSGKRIERPEETVRATNFFLGYHGLEDRALIAETCQVLLALTPSLGYVSPTLDRSPTGGRRLRVGFLSSNMRVHSVGRVLNRFLKELDRERFEVLLFELPGKFGGGQEQAREMADRTVFVPGKLDQARRAIEEERPDLLMIPDFVLDPFNDYLCYSRLAPVQCSTWGHPGTSGRPSMDYWISCEDWEPEGNDRLYTETLVRLSKPPMIASRLEPPETITSRESLGLPDGTLYGCPQSLYKLHPDFDGYLAEILRQDPRGWVVLIGGIQPRWLETFKLRFAEGNSDVSDRLVFLPHLSTSEYLSLLSHCAVSLDPIHFGGANTSMEAFTMGLPVVTLPGTQLRNRQTLSFYRMMGLDELIVENRADYVQKCVRLGTDLDYRKELSDAVRERCDVIFDTIDVTRKLEAFFEKACYNAIGG